MVTGGSFASCRLSDHLIRLAELRRSLATVVNPNPSELPILAHERSQEEGQRVSMSALPGVGFEYPCQDVSWTKRDALLFAWSIGCTEEELHFLYVRAMKHAIDDHVNMRYCFDQAAHFDRN